MPAGEDGEDDCIIPNEVFYSRISILASIHSEFRELSEAWRCPNCGDLKNFFIRKENKAGSDRMVFTSKKLFRVKKKGGTMNYQNESLPKGYVLSAKSPIMTEKTTPDAIQKQHRAPRGKTGCLKGLDRTLQFQWCDTGETFDAAPGHPIVISPERSHRGLFSGPVRYLLRLYREEKG